MLKTEMQQLRDSAGAIARALSGKDITVSFRGKNPAVQFDKAGKPTAIVLPNLPNKAAPELVMACRAFLYSKAAGMMFTDPIVEAATAGKSWSDLYTLLEGQRVEREICERFPGVARQTAQKVKWAIDKLWGAEVVKKLGEGADAIKLFASTLAEPALRAKGGDSACSLFMDDKWELLDGLIDVVGPDGFDRMVAVDSTQASADLAAELWDKMFPPPPPCEGEGQDQDSAKPQEQKENEADTPPPPPSAAAEEVPEEEEPEEVPEPPPPPVEVPVGGGSGAFEYSPLADQLVEAAEQVIHDVIDAAPYAVFTTDYDTVEPPTDAFIESALKGNDEAVQEFIEDTERHVGVLKMKLERALESRTFGQWVGGFRSGRINPQALYKIRVGDTRVFRRLEIADIPKTAVSYLSDESGSMRSRDRWKTAIECSYAITKALDRLGIECEALGFTTGDIDDYPDHISEEMSESEPPGGWSRDEPLKVIVYKSFAERIHSGITRRFAARHVSQRGLQNNVDGECVRIAAQRLLQRDVVRRVLIVGSDGSPCASGRHRDIQRDLKDAVKEVTAAGIEVIGVGIQTADVRRFYPKNFVVNHLEDLGPTLISTLRASLMH